MVLVDSLDSMRMLDEGGWQEISPGQTLWNLDAGAHCLHWDLRRFVNETQRGVPLPRIDDRELLALLRGLIRSNRLVGLRRAQAASASSTTTKLRRLVAEIEKAVHGKLSYQGRQYRLVVDVDFPTTPSRDSYEVASQSEARVVLDHAAKEGNAPADLLRQASEEISRDWRAPSSQPDGLVLLRRIPHRAAAQMDDGPAITPSQMKALLEDVVEVELVDADDAPVANEAWELLLPDGTMLSGQLDESGYARIGPVPTSGCQIRFPNLDAAAWAACN